jgi:hypothetical protein
MEKRRREVPMVFERNEFSEKESLDGKRSISLKAKHLFFFSSNYTYFGTLMYIR